MSWLTALPELAPEPDAPWALLADLHANLPATEAVAAYLREQGLGRVVVVGDLVGYGAQPAQVVDLVRHEGWLAIRGNHDEMVLGIEPENIVIKPYARDAIEWSRQRLAPEQLAYLGALEPWGRLGSSVVLVHGSLVDSRKCYAYLYDLSLDLNIRRLRELELGPGTLVVTGHTHRPAVFEVQGDEGHSLAVPAGGLELDPGRHYFVNPGSVGFSRDGDPRASLMIFEPRHRLVRLVRVAYDLDRAVASILEAGYGPRIAERLREAN
ncbi:MAG: metallophosphoesterase family protein [Thermoanaerobaculia bacterium]